MDPVPRSKLPTFGVNDGDQIVDSVGNIYEYDTNTLCWIYRGAAPAPPTVSCESDGLITPDVFRKISLLQELISKGVDFSNFKLDTKANNPYYYFFNSSDDLIRFSPEKLTEPKEIRFSSTIEEVGFDNNNAYIKILGLSFPAKTLVGLDLETQLGSFKIIDNSADVVVIEQTPDVRIGDPVRVVKSEAIKSRLRIEVDRGRLYQKLVRQCCVGPKGRQGEKGFSGPDGTPANSEVFQLPLDITGGAFAWSTTVETPLDTPISLRIFRDDDDENHIIELLFSTEGTETTTVIIVDESIQIEETSLEVDYEPTAKLFSGSIRITSGGEDIETWRYKARQQGPQGPQGDPGEAFLEIVTQLLDDPTVRSQEALITMRKAIASDDIVTLRAPLFEKVPASNLAAFGGDTIDDLLVDFFMAAQVTIRESRDIGFFQFTPREFATPPLDLPLWTPTKDCVQSRRWVQYRFDWFDRVEPKYLFHILPTPKPPEQCCQEDFFFCPNLGDACPPQGGILPPRPMPIPCECECPNPLSGEFYDGGLELDPIDLTDPQTFVDDPAEDGETEDLSNVVIEDPDAIIALDQVKASAIAVVGSVIDGTQQTFTQEITMMGNGEVRVALDYDSDICGGISERLTKSFVDSDNIKSIITLQDPSGQATISNGGIWETNTIPVAVGFTVQTPIRPTEDVIPETQPGEVAVCAEEYVAQNPETELPDGLEIIGSSTTAVPVTLILTIIVNVDEVNYCRGYRLTTSARSDRTMIPIPKTFLIIPEEETGIPIEEGTETIIEIPEPPPLIQPPVEPPFISPPSYAPTAIIVSGGVDVDAPDTVIGLIGEGLYTIGYALDGGAFSPVDDENILISLNGGENQGQIFAVPGPSQTPIHQDALNFNSKLIPGTITLNSLDAGFDPDGLFGPGTYLLGQNLVTTFNSLIPLTNIRTDRWTDVIGFINQPQDSSEKEELVIIGRISSSALINSANSLFALELGNSGLTEGVIAITLGNSSVPIMDAINNGEIALFGSGSVTLSYFGEELAGRYPQILISPTVPPEPDLGCVGSINDFQVYPTPTIESTDSIYELSIGYDFDLPSDAVLIVDFPVGADISGVLDSSISSPVMDGSFSTSVSGQQLVIFRVGGVNTPSVSANLFIDDIVNPPAGSLDIDLTIEDGSGETCDGPVGTSFAVTAVGGTPSDLNSTVVISGKAGVPPTTESLIADDFDMTEITVTILDDSSLPVVGATVTLTTNDAFADTLLTPSGLTDASGVFKSYFRSSSSGFGASTISAFVDGFVGGGFAGALSDTAIIFKRGKYLGLPFGSNGFSIASSNTTVGAVGVTYTITFNAYYTPEIDGGIIIDFGPFGPGTTPTGTSVATWTSVDGTVTSVLAGDVITITRAGDGTQGPPNGVGNDSPDGASVHTIVITDMTNGPVSGINSYTMAPVGGGGGFLTELGLYILTP